MKVFRYPLFLFLLFSCKINKERDQIPVGRWKYVSGNKEERTVIKGRYDRKGREKGIWKYYVNDTLFRAEKYYYPYSVTVLYHRNGMISEVGKSITNSTSWSKYGIWYRFSDIGILTDSVNYEE